MSGPPSLLAPATADRSKGIWRIAALLLALLLGSFDLADGDLWLHLRTGQLIWQAAAPPATDWFGSTNPPARWIDLNWGFQLAAAGLWALGGAMPLVLAKAALLSVALAGCLSITRPSWPTWETVACWLIPLLIVADNWHVRPEVVSAALLACTLAIVHRAAQHPAACWLLPPVQLLWINTSEQYALQLLVVACFLTELYGRRWGWLPSQGPLPSSRLVTTASWSAALCLAACAANPYGLRGALTAARLQLRLYGPDAFVYQAGGDELYRFGRVLQYPNASGLAEPTRLLLAFLVLLVGLSLLAVWRRQRSSFYRVSLLAVFGLLAWRLPENVMFLAIVAGSVLRLNLGEIAAAAAPAMTDHTAGRALGGWNRSRLPAILTGLCLSLLIISIPTGLYQVVRPTLASSGGLLGESAGLYPHAVVELLATPGFPRRVYAAHKGLAALAVFHLAPERQVLADSRLAVNDRESLQRYRQIRRQLAAGDPAAEQNLLRGVEPDEAGRRPLPALLLDVRTLAWSSLGQPSLLDGILSSGRWRCVCCFTGGEQGRYDPEEASDGAAIFLETGLADQLQLEGADLTVLRALIAELQAELQAELPAEMPAEMRPISNGV